MHRLQYLFLFILFSGAIMAAKDVRYQVRIEEPNTHMVDVDVEVDGLTGDFIDFSMPVWTPGSYLVREYSKNVISAQAHRKTKALKVRKIDKNTWRVNTEGYGKITFSYWVYAFELSVRTSFVDTEFALLIGAGIFMIPEGFENNKLFLTIEPYFQWNKATTELPRYKGSPFSFVAGNFDQLIDSPILLGNQKTYQFKAAGIPHTFSITGEGNYDADQIMEDTKAIILAAKEIFGELPYDHYTFTLILTDNGYGGLEHKNSCTMIYDRWKFQDRKDYLKFMGLVSHEYFHTFNVKRIRPVELGPFDYFRENYTSLLWVSEGITSYYDNLLLLRSGVADVDEYLEFLEKDIKRLEKIPGRKIQSIAQSSFDSWIKLYRPNENSVNSTVSYYLKGSLVGLVLDLEIRESTGGTKSLDDVFRALWKDYKSSGDGFTEKEFMDLCETVAGKSLENIWSFVHTTEEMNFDKYLESVGLHLVKEYEKDDEPGVWFGISVNKGNMKIQKVFSDGPAWNADLNVGDELIAMNGIRLTSSNYQKLMKAAEPEIPCDFIISRRGLIKNISISPVTAPADKYQIKRLDEPSDLQKALYESWLLPPFDAENNSE